MDSKMAARMQPDKLLSPARNSGDCGIQEQEPNPIPCACGISCDDQGSQTGSVLVRGAAPAFTATNSPQKTKLSAFSPYASS